MKITNIKAREILDSRGNPTISVDIITNKEVFNAKTPSGASTGKYEAIELRDKDKKRYNGKGVLKAVKNINTIIKKKLIGLNPENQKQIDELLIKLDGTENKSRLGANAIVAISMAVCRAGAKSKNMKLYEYIKKIAGNKQKLKLPNPSFNILNGGVHSGNELPIQEFMIYPINKSFKQSLRMGSEIYHTLKNIIKKEYGMESINVGDEGGFAPNIKDSFEALNLLNKAINKAGYKGKVKINIDCAASEFYKNKRYDLGFKSKKHEILKGEQLLNYYEKMVKKYNNIFSIEDPFNQEDWENFTKITKKIGDKVQIMGDDLTVTNVKRIKKAIEKKAINSLLLKINQIGTLSETIESWKMAKSVGWKVMVSHRSGETSDSFIADLCVGLGCEQIKSGAPCRSERLAKYNRLLKIEEELQKNKKID